MSEREGYGFVSVLLCCIVKRCGDNFHLLFELHFKPINHFICLCVLKNVCSGAVVFFFFATITQAQTRQFLVL